MQGDFRFHFHLAPPLLARPDPATGRPRKMEFGPWILPLFRVLKRLRFLRGGFFDPFARSADRKAERALIAEYEALIEEIVPTLRPDNHALAVALAALPDQIRGYGPIKAAAIEDARRRRVELLDRYRKAARDRSGTPERRIEPEPVG
jgi:indolepyruvate ferredoxin oxidoreductase